MKVLNNLFLKTLINFQSRNFHLSLGSLAWIGNEKKSNKWLEYNKVVFPPRKPDEERIPAFVCHQRLNIKYSPKKMWYIACLVRGMSVDKAIEQLKFVMKKGAQDVREVIEEAKQLAVKEHNVEFGSNLWVAESFIGKGTVIKGIRRHARARYGEVRYMHCHYFVRLEEGEPPKEYYQTMAKKPHEMLEDWLKQMRERKINASL